MTARFRALYGAHPLHLLVLLGAFGLAGSAVLAAAGEPDAGRMAVWFVAAVLAADLVLLPLTALVDRGLRAVLPPALLAAVRVPLLGAGLLLLVFAPVITRRSAADFGLASGRDLDPFLGRWLLVCAVLVGASLLVAGARRVRAR